MSFIPVCRGFFKRGAEQAYHFLQMLHAAGTSGAKSALGFQRSGSCGRSQEKPHEEGVQDRFLKEPNSGCGTWAVTRPTGRYRQHVFKKCHVPAGEPYPRQATFLQGGWPCRAKVMSAWDRWGAGRGQRERAGAWPGGQGWVRRARKNVRTCRIRAS